MTTKLKQDKKWRLITSSPTTLSPQNVPSVHYDYCPLFPHKSLSIITITKSSHACLVLEYRMSPVLKIRWNPGGGENNHIKYWEDFKNWIDIQIIENIVPRYSAIKWNNQTEVLLLRFSRFSMNDNCEVLSSS